MTAENNSERKFIPDQEGRAVPVGETWPEQPRLPLDLAINALHLSSKENKKIDEKFIRLQNLHLFLQVCRQHRLGTEIKQQIEELVAELGLNETEEVKSGKMDLDGIVGRVLQITIEDPKSVVYHSKERKRKRS